MMREIQQDDKIRIKDIAEKAGVSVGTVDRVIHNRPNVSKAARSKVEAVLNEINYQPNIYASALAYNKAYCFCCLLPRHDSNAYWTEVEDGLEQCIVNYRDFQLNLATFYYDQFDEQSFEEAARQIEERKPQGVIIVPQTERPTTTFCEHLEANEIPYVFLDSYVPTLHPLAFFGQDPVQSGVFAASILSLTLQGTSSIMIMNLVQNGRVASRQQQLREEGFRDYMHCNHPEIKIWTLTLQMDEEKDYDKIIESFFIQHPEVKHAITFCSRTYILGDYFEKRELKDVNVFGYDMIPKNVAGLSQGYIDYIIAQHPWQQGYNCVEALFNHIVLKKDHTVMNYMPLELLTIENYKFYRTKQ